MVAATDTSDEAACRVTACYGRSSRCCTPVHTDYGYNGHAWRLQTSPVLCRQVDPKVRVEATNKQDFPIYEMRRKRLSKRQKFEHNVTTRGQTLKCDGLDGPDGFDGTTQPLSLAHDDGGVVRRRHKGPGSIRRSTRVMMMTTRESTQLDR